MERERIDVEAAAHTATEAGERDRAAKLVTDFMSRTVDAALAAAEDLVAHI